jgi:hypothetical protein
MNDHPLPQHLPYLLENSHSLTDNTTLFFIHIILNTPSTKNKQTKKKAETMSGSCLRLPGCVALWWVH